MARSLPLAWHHRHLRVSKLEYASLVHFFSRYGVLRRSQLFVSRIDDLHVSGEFIYLDFRFTSFFLGGTRYRMSRIPA